MYQSLIIVDDFYPDPLEVRRTALGFEYPEFSGPPTFPGRNSRQKFTPPAWTRRSRRFSASGLQAEMPNPPTVGSASRWPGMRAAT